MATSPPVVDRPLAGITIVDLTRLLPGAALAHLLIGLGARVVKIEDPQGGDPLRQLPPLVEGTGAGFAALLAGAESVCLDLHLARDVQRLRQLASRADVLIEGFRPSTLASLGLGPHSLSAANPGLILCSLPAYPEGGPLADRVGHDLNFVAQSGLLSLLGRESVPPVQLADLGGALLACSAILAALFQRSRTGKGQHVVQPLWSGATAFMPWLYADERAGGPGFALARLAGRCPGYRTYSCGDGLLLAIAAVEPKFWQGLLERLNLSDLGSTGLESGPQGLQATAAIAEVLGTRPRAHWLQVLQQAGLPVSPVNDLAAALQDPVCHPDAALAVASWGVPPGAAVPPVGADTARVLADLDDR
ncbi:MAG: CoA transferase [Cyanobacteria bacterium REEB65]|nr:CoA transferase [Cyanobacteria bacterium REEB65]